MRNTQEGAENRDKSPKNPLVLNKDKDEYNNYSSCKLKAFHSCMSLTCRRGDQNFYHVNNVCIQPSEPEARRMKLPIIILLASLVPRPETGTRLTPCMMVTNWK